MRRKAIIIAIIITALFMIFGQVWIIGDFKNIIQKFRQPEWALSTSTLIAAQLGLYFAVGYIIYRLMMVHQLMIKPTIFLLIITFAFWEAFKISVFDWQYPVLGFFLLICYIIFLLLLNLFLFREDGLAGIVCVPLCLFSVFYLAPWYYQVMLLNTAQ